MPSSVSKTGEKTINLLVQNVLDVLLILHADMDVLLNGFSISAERELQSLCCMMGKTMSLRCHLLAANVWPIID